MQPAATVDSPKHEPLAARVASGFAWSFAATLVAKVVGFASYIALARLLAPDDFGAYAKAMIVVAFASIARDNGLPQILIYRHAQLPRLANAGFWMSTFLSVICGAAMIMLAPFASRYFASPLVGGIILLYGLASPLMAFGNVPNSMIIAQLRFKLLAMIGAGAVAVTTAVSIALAAEGFGAYSLAWGMIAGGVFRAAVTAWFCFPRLRADPELAQWADLAWDSGMFTIMALFQITILYADYFILSRRFNDTIVGYYYFAFTFSMQAVTLVTASLSNVLFPALSRLTGEPVRQVEAYIRASRLLAIVAVPICVIQAAIASLLIVLVFGAKWTPSIHLFQILSVAALFVLLLGPSTSMLEAQGRFKLLAIWSAVMAIGFVASVQVGASFGAAMGVAVAVAAFHVVAVPVQIWISLGRQMSARILWRVLGIPLTASVAAAGLPMAMMLLRPGWCAPGAPQAWRWSCLIGSGIWMTLVYARLIHLMSPSECRDLAARFLPYLRPVFRHRAPNAA